MKMQTFRKPHQWLNFWLEKYADTLSGLKYTSEQRKQYWATLKIFLEKLPGNPRNIDLDAIRSFILEDAGERLLPVMLFYKHIAPSKPHLEMLNQLANTAAPPSDTPSDPVEQFKSILSNREFSERTVKNYATVAVTFTRWFDRSVHEMTTDDIDEYCHYIDKEKGLSQRTVALHRTALKLFHEFITDGSGSETSP